MNVRTRTRTRIAAASLAAMAVLGMSATVSAMPAHAAPATDVSVATIDATKTANLHVTKYLSAPTNLPNNGTQQQVPAATPTLSGVVFDVYQVQGVDLTTNAGWQQAAAINGYTPTQADIAAGTITVGGTTYTITKTTSVTTNSTGQADFTGLPLGLYVVNENLASSTTIVNNATGAAVPTASVTPSVPFFVTLPMTDPVNLNAWNYDVYAYPKNASDTITKSVQDLGVAAASNGTGNTSNTSYNHTIAYTLTSTVTPGLTGDQIGLYVVGDKFDPSFTPDQITVTTNQGTVTLADGTDYTVYFNNAAVAAGGTYPSGGSMQIVLSATGLNKIAGQTNVVTTITGTLDNKGASSSDVANTATLIPNNTWWNNQMPTTPFNPTTPGGSTPTTPNTSNKVDTLLGALVIAKYDGSGPAPIAQHGGGGGSYSSGANAKGSSSYNSGGSLSGASFGSQVAAQVTGASPTPATPTMLAGAVFSVYKDATPGDNTCSTTDMPAANLIASNVTTDGAGYATVTGLQASNYVNGATVTDPTKGITYCLVETQAPNGYNLNANAIPFTINADATTMTAAITTVNVADEKTNLGNTLPLTGGAGAAAGIGGFAILLFGAAATFGVVSRRRNRDDHEPADEA